MSEIIAPIEELAEAFGSLPGVGKKTALKYAFSFLDMQKGKADKFISALGKAQTSVKHCVKCYNYSEGDYCPVCADVKRDRTTVCVVEDCRSLIALERARAFGGVYHIIGGVISPMKSIGPDKLRIAELLSRVSEGEIKEVILAMNATLEGETTAMYIAGLLKPYNVRVSRLAYGLPAGGDLEYTDELTLSRALQGRSDI